MGLVSTWLNGIGLRSVVPTFEAAGIVSPSHLADLDVSYFESLGVTDPDDRRKLFYLVQRIKLAVNNKKDSNSKSPTISVEERVDAVVSENFDNEDEENTKHNNYKGNDDGQLPADAEESPKHPFREEKKADETPARRSRRIRAFKKKSKKFDSKEKKESETERQSSPTVPVAAKKNSSPSATKKSALAQRKSKKEVVKSPPSSPSKFSPLKKTSSKLVKERKEPSSKSVKERKEKAERKAKKEVVKSPPSSPSRRSPSKPSPSKKPSSKSVKERKEKVSSRTQTLSKKSAIPSALSVLNLSSKDHTIGDIDDDANEQTDDIDKNTLATAQMLHKADSSRGSKSHFPSRQQPESKLPGSTRTSKRLPVTSIQKIASLTSAEQYSSSLSNIQDDEVRTKRSDVSNLQARRRVTLAASIDSLGTIHHSPGRSPKQYRANDTIELTGSNVHSGNDMDVTSRRGRNGSIPRITTSRSSKSMSVSESSLLQQYQGNHSKRSSISSTRNLSSATATTSSRNLGIPSLSAPVITQVAREGAESWATKINYLREDNDAEHELFRDQVEDESQYHEYYDMRIKVIVRKRPLSKSESLTGGTDIIHPLDFGSYGKTLVYQPKTRVDLTKEVETVPFAFDNVFNESSTNIGIYNRSLRNLVEPFFKGQWATVFAYGQTGSG